MGRKGVVRSCDDCNQGGSDNDGDDGGDDHHSDEKVDDGDYQKGFSKGRRKFSSFVLLSLSLFQEFL